jgi:DmsE family decaheme c-type cytochrome
MNKRSGIGARTWGLVAALLLALLCRPALAQEDCATCHEDAAKAFAKTSHGTRFARDKSTGCASCHGPGDAHIQASGAGGIMNPAKGKAAEANQVCLSCHEGKPMQAHWQGSPHQAAGLKCASCHDVHQQHAGTPVQANRLPGANESTQKCVGCHGNVRAAMSQRSAHPLKDGQMSCVSCHNPHGSAGEKLIQKASTNDLCQSCHQQMRGPFLWEHSPVREDCLTCHKPHGSNQPSMLQARATQLCQSCHQQGRHQTVPGLPASAWVSNRACLNCHSQVHGSNHPSGPLFQR